MSYYLLYSFFSVLAFFNTYIKNKFVVRTLVIIVSVLLIVFAGIRFNVGFDYANYQLYYNEVVNDREIFVEPIIRGFIHVSEFTTIGFIGFIIVMALVSVSIKSKFILQYSAIPLLSIVLYYTRIYIISDFGQVRQGLALGIILFSYKYILNRDLKKFLLIVVMAMLIHAAAFLFLPIYFIGLKRIRPAFLFIIMIITIPLAAVDLKSIMISVFGKLLPGGLSDKLMFYSLNETFIGLTFSIFLRGGIVILCLTVYWKKISENRNSLLIFNIYFWGYIFYLLFNSLPQIGGRGSLYFQQFELLLFPLMLTLTRNKVMQFFLLLFFLFYCYWGLNTTLTSQDAFIPYQNIIQDDSN
jgi:hypothetical protein